MDRFIAISEPEQAEIADYLKSNMDRFIDFNVNARLRSPAI